MNAAQNRRVEQTRNMARVLDSVGEDGVTSQRRIAADLGIAVGLVNVYLKRCIKKGLIKARQAPARRYVYYLTPQGFAEKSRLTVEYLSHSFEIFRQAKRDCKALFEIAKERGFVRVVLAGQSDLAEIAAICAFEGGIKIVAVVDRKAYGKRFAGIPLFRDFEDLAHEPDAVIITDLLSTAATVKHVVARFGSNRALIPALLQPSLRRQQEKGA